MVSDSGSSNDSRDFMDSPFFQRANQTRSRLQGERLTVQDLINERFDRSTTASPGELPSVVDEESGQTDEAGDGDRDSGSSGDSPLGGTLDVSA